MTTERIPPVNYSGNVPCECCGSMLHCEKCEDPKVAELMHHLLWFTDSALVLTTSTFATPAPTAPSTVPMASDASSTTATAFRTRAATSATPRGWKPSGKRGAHREACRFGE
jgi:hypothetical protein